MLDGAVPFAPPWRSSQSAEGEVERKAQEGEESRAQSEPALTSRRTPLDTNRDRTRQDTYIPLD